jgi:hypothetical protein
MRGHEPARLPTLLPRHAARTGDANGERRDDEGAAVQPDQIFQPAIQSISLEPAGFMPCLVETTSSGLIVTKS